MIDSIAINAIWAMSVDATYKIFCVDIKVSGILWLPWCSPAVSFASNFAFWNAVVTCIKSSNQIIFNFWTFNNCFLVFSFILTWDWFTIASIYDDFSFIIVGLLKVASSNIYMIKCSLKFRYFLGWLTIGLYYQFLLYYPTFQHKSKLLNLYLLFPCKAQQDS